MYKLTIAFSTSIILMTSSLEAGQTYHSNLQYIAPNWHWHTPRGDVRQAVKQMTCKNGRQGYLYKKRERYFVTNTSYIPQTKTYTSRPPALYEYCQ
jgi:hypothetical protein